MTTPLPCVEGESLPQYIARTGKLPALQALALVGQLLATLGAVHRQGMAFPGLACDDLLVLPCGRLAVTAWAVTQRDRLGLGSRSQDDLLAAARVAYALTTRGTLAGDAAGRDVAWVPPSHHGLPVALDGVFERALSAHAQERYATADALWQAIWEAMGPPVWDRPLKPAAKPAPPRTALAAQPAMALRAATPPPKARPPAPPPRSFEPVPLPPRELAVRRSHRATWAGAALAVLLAFVLGAIAWQLFATPKAQAPEPARDAQSRQQPATRAPAQQPVEVRTAASAQPPPEPQPSAPVPAQQHAQPQSEPRQRSAEPTQATAAPDADAAEPLHASRPRAPALQRAAREPQRTVTAGSSAGRLRQVRQASDPSLGCHQDFLFARELCKLSQCATAAYGSHPTCRAMREEQRRRDWEADQALRTR